MSDVLTYFYIVVYTQRGSRTLKSEYDVLFSTWLPYMPSVSGVNRLC